MSYSDANLVRMHNSRTNVAVMTAPSTIVFAPDSFKGSASARQAASAMARGWASVRPLDTLVLKPMADGGEGTLDAFESAVPGSTRMPVRVTGPDDRPVDASWLLLADGTGVIELASTSGITLLNELRPDDAHSRGFGQAIVSALDFGVRRVVLAIGGSSSTDGGAGVLEELGARFLDASGRPVRAGNRGLHHLSTTEFHAVRPLPPGGVDVLCDVTNPLLGADGAAAVYGPQKGAATAEAVHALERGLATLARSVSRAGPVAHPDADPTHPGAGAAGGVGFGLLVWGARLVPGSTGVAEICELPAAIASCDVVVTGEGSFDSQSAAGKAVSAVLAAASVGATRVDLVAGRISAPTVQFADALSLSVLAGSAEAAQVDAERWLEVAGAALAERF
ncbi:glycerate kinase [Agreia pratensis]|uniref:Glycerate kinase n=2 Tax=Agreia pratensis TaxID=150121 RepID=A0A1X7IJ15_9MICO|nr:glycerate kinase [Agreia pratensis]